MSTCPTCGQNVPATTVDKLEEAGKRAAAEMGRLWKLDIFDPPIGSRNPRTPECLAVIEKIIKINGWDWALPYRGNGAPQWCGMTAGAAWASAGLDPSWLATYFASTYRLALWASYQRFDAKGKQNPAPLQGVARRLYVNLTKPFAVTPRSGDIVIVGDGDPQAGDHVTICMSYSGGVFDTISGNGGGEGPNGNAREGVSRRPYALGTGGYRPLWLIRPAESDLL